MLLKTVSVRQSMNCIVLLSALSLLYGCGATSEGSSPSTSSPTPSDTAVSFSITPQKAALQAGNSFQFTVVSHDLEWPVTRDPRGNSAQRTSLQAANSLQFTAASHEPPTNDLEWLVNGVPGGNSASGTISRSGRYIAPQHVTSNAVIVIAVIFTPDPCSSMRV